MDRQTRQLTLAGVAVALVLTLLVYWSGLDGPFVLDDGTNIVKTWIADPDWDAVRYTLAHNVSGPLGRGVSVLSFMLTGQLHGPEPWGFKFHNLLLHLTIGVVLFCWLRRCLPLLQPAAESRRLLLTAGLTALFWMLHPLQVSTVLYAVQRMTQLAVLFTLLALLAHHAARIRPRADWRYVVYGWVLFPLFGLLAVLSKETGVLIPLYVVVSEVLVHRTDLALLRRERRHLVWLLVFVVLPLVLGCAGLILMFDSVADYSNRNFTLVERLLTQLHVVAHYVHMILLPRLRGMGLYQDDFPVTSSFDLPTLLLFVLLLGILVAIWLLRRRQPVLAFGLALFVVSHLLESTFIPLEMVFEHRNYLAVAGLLMPVVHGLVMVERPALRPLRGLLAVLLLLLLMMTSSRVQEWRSQDMLITIAVQEHPQSSRTRTEYANYLFNNGRNNEGLEQLELTAMLDPRDPGPVLHRLVYRCLQGEGDTELLAVARELLANWPASVYALNSLDILIARQISGECTELNFVDSSALVETALGLDINLRNGQAHGFLLRFRGILAFQTGQYVAGVVALRMAHEASGQASILSELMGYQITIGRLDDAADTLALVREIDNATWFRTETHLVKRLEASLDRALQAPPAQP